MADGRRNGFLGFLGVLWRGLDFTRRAFLNLVFFGIVAIIVVAAMKGAPRVEPDSVLVLHPEGALVEQYSVDPATRALAALSGGETRQVQLRDLLRVIDAARTDPRIRMILLEPQDLSAGGFAALREVGAALDRFRAGGKKVVVWAPDFDQLQYYLAVHADRVLMDPQGSLMITGLSSYRLYYKDLLDKLGVVVHLFRVGQFKSAAEPYILDGPSPAAQEADGAWLGGLWNEWIAEVAKARHLDPAVLTQQIAAMPQQVAAAHGDLARMALNGHLVDGLATRGELVAALRKDGVPAGEEGHGIRGVGFAQYLAAVKRAGTMPASGPGVAVVVAEGEIVPGRQQPGTIGGDATARLIRAAREDKNVKALVLRVDSPGGAVFPAELIRREVQLTRAAGKPVIVSMGDVAASGGYWISMDANRILAEPDTITGSIGIFGLFFNVPDTLAKIGVHAGGVGTTPWAGAFDVTRPLDPQVGQMIQANIDKGYRDFVGGVARARGKSFADIDAIAQGRVWTGQQALELGLVDQLGGLDTAIRLAASDARLGSRYSVRYMEKPPGAFSRFLLDMSNSAMAQFALAHGVRLPSWVAALAPQAGADLGLLAHASAGKPNVYAYCFCTPH